METFVNLQNFFATALQGLPCHEDTRAYIISLFSKFKVAQTDLSKDNITLTFAQARFNQDFSIYQKLGDWIFFSKSLFPEYLVAASDDYYYNIGRISYYSCYKLINKEWKLFEELSDNFIILEQHTKILLSRELKQKKLLGNI